MFEDCSANIHQTADFILSWNQRWPSQCIFTDNKILTLSFTGLIRGTCVYVHKSWKTLSSCLRMLFLYQRGYNISLWCTIHNSLWQGNMAWPWTLCAKLTQSLCVFSLNTRHGYSGSWCGSLDVWRLSSTLLFYLS